MSKTDEKIATSLAATLVTQIPKDTLPFLAERKTILAERKAQKRARKLSKMSVKQLNEIGEITKQIHSLEMERKTKLDAIGIEIKEAKRDAKKALMSNVIPIQEDFRKKVKKLQEWLKFEKAKLQKEYKKRLDVLHAAKMVLMEGVESLIKKSAGESEESERRLTKECYERYATQIDALRMRAKNIREGKDHEPETDK